MLEEIVIVRRPGLLKIGEQMRVGLETDLASTSVCHSGWITILLGGQDLPHERGEDLLAFPNHHEINPGKGPEVFQAHLPVKVGAAEHDLHLRIQVLDQFGHGQAGDILVEGGRESHNLVLAPVDRGHGPGQKLGSSAGVDLFKKRGRMAALSRHVFKHRFERPHVLVMVPVLAEEETGEEPFTEERPFLADDFV